MSNLRHTGRALVIFIVVTVVILFLTLGYVDLSSWGLQRESNTRAQSEYDVGYTRDYLGYIYPKEYLQFQEKDGPPKKFLNISLTGRHSDAVMSECSNTKGNDPLYINDKYKMTGPFKYLKHYKNPCWWEDGQVNKTLVCIPYFYFIGTVKAGSTDLFWRLEMHPHVAGVSVKEKRWFDTVRFTHDKKNNFKFYLHQFNKAAGQIMKATRDTGYHHKIVGDGSPTYMYNNFEWTQLPGNEGCLEPRVVSLSYVHHLLPTAKLILIVRNPVDRLYSDYLFNAGRTNANCTPEEFHKWASLSVRTYADCFKEHPIRFCLYSKHMKLNTKISSFTANFYSRLLLDVLRIFPRNQLLVVQMEDYSKNMAQRLEKVFHFLGLDPLSEEKMQKIVNTRQYNKGGNYKKSGAMLSATRKMLYRFFKPFNEELAQILNDKKYLWLENE